MLYLFRERRDLYAGALMILVGAGVAAEGLSLRVGALTHMGPGFFPLALGILLVGLGVIIAVSSRHDQNVEDAVGLDLRGGACILLGVTAFIALGSAFGFVAATFSAIFIAALGDRQSTPRASFALAAGLTVSGAIVFPYFLRVPFPLYHWF
jgi:putative tricarboxylic transport membrane protein